MNPPTNRAIGIVRVSEQGDRPDERLRSPDEQTERIREYCATHELELIADPRPEIDVSGTTELDQRLVLREAIEAIEAGRATVLVAAYFDRLFRSLKVQAEVLERVERAGGRVCALDVGDISQATAAQWFSASALGMLAEYASRSARERSRRGIEAAVRGGAYVGRGEHFGYTKDANGHLYVEPERPIPGIISIESHLVGVSCLTCTLPQSGDTRTGQKILWH